MENFLNNFPKSPLQGSGKLYNFPIYNLNQYATLLVTATVEASRRLFPSAPVKSLPLQAAFVPPIVRSYVFGSAASKYSCIIGAALAAGSVLATRYNDVMQLRLHPDYAEWGLDQASGLHFLEFFLAHRIITNRPPTWHVLEGFFRGHDHGAGSA